MLALCWPDLARPLIRAKNANIKTFLYFLLFIKYKCLHLRKILIYYIMNTDTKDTIKTSVLIIAIAAPIIYGVVRFYTWYVASIQDNVSNLLNMPF